MEIRKDNSMSKEYYYFAYGANLNLEGMQNRCPGYRKVEAALLHNYKLVFRGVADVIPAAGDAVMGAVYLLNKEHFAALDRFEGYPHLYIRKVVEVETLSGKKLQAVVYIMTKKSHPRPPSDHYLSTIIKGLQQWHLSESYQYELIEQAELLEQQA